MINGAEMLEFVMKCVIENICNNTQSEILTKEEPCQPSKASNIVIDLIDLINQKEPK